MATFSQLTAKPQARAVYPNSSTNINKTEGHHTGRHHSLPQHLAPCPIPMPASLSPSFCALLAFQPFCSSSAPPRAQQHLLSSCIISRNTWNHLLGWKIKRMHTVPDHFSLTGKMRNKWKQFLMMGRSGQPHKKTLTVIPEIQVEDFSWLCWGVWQRTMLQTKRSDEF